MNILWIYDHPFNPEAGGTERLTKIISDGLKQRGHNCMAILVFDQVKRGNINYNGRVVRDLYCFLNEFEIDIVINQIAYAYWLLKDFYKFGGQKWHDEGGKVISCLHFDPKFPSISIPNLLVNWSKLNLFRKIKRLVRISLTPLYNWRERRFHRYSYAYVYKHSDFYVLLSNTHKSNFLKCSGLNCNKKLISIFNPLTFP